MSRNLFFILSISREKTGKEKCLSINGKNHGQHRDRTLQSMSDIRISVRTGTTFPAMVKTPGKVVPVCSSYSKKFAVVELFYELDG